MSTLKNKVIAAMVAAITSKIDQEGITPEEKKVLQGQVEQLTALDKVLIDQDNVIDNQKNQITILEQHKAEALETITDLQQELEKALEVKADASALPVGEYKKVKYQVKCGAHGYGSAKEIAAAPDKIAAILKINGQNILEPLNA